MSRAFQRFYHRALTPAGRVLFWAFILSLGLGGSSPALQICYVPCTIFGMLVSSWLFGRLNRPRLIVTRGIPLQSTVGAEIESKLKVTNVGTREGLLLEVREDALPAVLQEVSGEEDAFSLAPGESRELRRRYRCARRGVYQLDRLVVESGFPFGLLRRRLNEHRESATLTVFPRFSPLARTEIPVGTRHQPGGLALTSSVGDSTEFIGNREYQYGDSPRAIHWQSWARLARPVVKEFQEEYFCRIALILDSYVQNGDGAAFESAVSLAASVADYLSRFEYIIDIFVAGEQLYQLQAGRSLGYLDNVLELLACVDVATHDPFTALGPRLVDELARITTVVLVLLDWDERRAQLVQLVREQGAQVKVLVVRAGPTTLEPDADVRLVDPAEERQGIEEL